MFSRTQKDILKFAIPLITGQVGQMLLGIGDMVVAGRYSKEVVSAIGVAGGIFGVFLMLGLGLSYAFAPLLATRMGEGRRVQGYLATILVHSGIFALALMSLMGIFAFWGIPLLKLSPVIEPIVKEYFWIVLFSMFPIMIFQGIKEYLQVQKDIWFANVLVIFANVSNLILNIVLCFGIFGFPEMGAKGLAWATLTNRLLMMVALLYYIRKDLMSGFKLVKEFAYESVKLGLPIAISILMEVSIFTVVTVLIGRMDVTTSAAHNIILSIGSFSFMFPLALGNTAATLVSIALAEGKPELARAYAYGTLKLAVMFEVTTTILFILAPTLIMSIYTDKLDVIAKGGELIIFAALFQLPDGIQVTLSGILRGMKITRPVMILTMIGYWVISLPLGLYLAFSVGLMAKGLWIGLVCALSVMAVLLYLLLLKVSASRFSAGAVRT